MREKIKTETKEKKRTAKKKAKNSKKKQNKTQLYYAQVLLFIEKE